MNFYSPDGIDEDHGNNGYAKPEQAFAGMEVFGQETERCGKPEQQRQKVDKLRQQAEKQRTALQFMDLIGAIAARRRTASSVLIPWGLLSRVKKRQRWKEPGFSWLLTAQPETGLCYRGADA